MLSPWVQSGAVRLAASAALMASVFALPASAAPKAQRTAVDRGAGVTARDAVSNPGPSTTTEKEVAP